MINVKLALSLLLLLPCISPDPNLRILTFPVGQGDSTLIECDDGATKIGITLIDAGSGSKAKKEILSEYITYITSKLRDPKYRLENIFLTIADPDHYGFIKQILNLLRDEEALKIKFYIGGTRSSYEDLELSTKYSDNVIEFTRKDEDANSISSCGHYPWGDTRQNFYNCVKRNQDGPIPDTNGVVNICNNFQITIMAANYGLSHEFAGSLNGSNSKHKNSLVLKITPKDKATPSMLIMGDFENDEIANRDNATGKVYYNYIKGAHWRYTNLPNTPMTINRGLETTIYLVPQHGADTNVNSDTQFVADFIKPTYAIVSSDIHNAYGYPQCKVIKVLNMYMRQFAARDKEQQCHVSSKSEKTKDAINSILVAENIFQTTVINTNDYVLRFHLITFSMDRNQVLPPLYENIFVKNME